MFPLPTQFFYLSYSLPLLIWNNSQANNRGKIHKSILNTIFQFYLNDDCHAASSSVTIENKFFVTGDWHGADRFEGESKNITIV